jgi:ABC-type uncharacterized transport system fused permease/ATPase subunit
MLAKLYVNPWFDEKHLEVYEIWENVGNTTITDVEYYASFYTAVWNFLKVLGVQALMNVVGYILGSLLNNAITVKGRCELMKAWLSNDAAYGVHVGNKPSGAEGDHEKANLTPAQLFEDIENQSVIISLWDSRINNIISCYTAVCGMFTLSPPMELYFYFGTITLPYLLVIGAAYSLFQNCLLALFEAPARSVFQKMKQLKDKVVRQINQVNNHAELITFLKGEDFEREKVLRLLGEGEKQFIKHSFLDSAKALVLNIVTGFSWLFPIIAAMDSVRSGLVKRAAIGSCMHHGYRINGFITWAKDNFDQITLIEESVRRLTLYNLNSRLVNNYL